MDSLHVLGAGSTATVVAGGVRMTFDAAVSFEFRLWWYDVQQVEGAV